MPISSGSLLTRGVTYHRLGGYFPGIEHLYHLALAEDWERAPEKNYETSTLGVALSDQGFIHCSFRHQVQDIADLVYREREDVLLLKIDPDRLSARVKVEVLRDGEAAFPHIYGPLNRAAVVEASRLRLLADGRLDASEASKRRSLTHWCPRTPDR